jgi:hypothetical protein
VLLPRWLPVVLFAASPLAAPLAAFGLAELTVPPNGISGCQVLPADGGNFQEDAAVTVMTPSADHRDVLVGAMVTHSSPSIPLYVGNFHYSCLLTGNGTLEYGSASGTLNLETSSTPDFLPPAPGNMNDPFYNDGRSEGEALLELQFDDTGIVVSDVLPDGTPVQLEFTFVLESTAVATGAPLGAPLLAAEATYFPHAQDTTSGATAEWILSGSGQVTRTLDTQVGRTIALRGRLALDVQAIAGREVSALSPYYADVQASVDAANSSHFTLQLPPDVGFVTESGHDYTVPEPGHALLLVSGALMLAGSRRRAVRP